MTPSVLLLVATAIGAPGYSTQPLRVSGVVKAIVPADYNGDPLVDLLVSSVSTKGPLASRTLALFFQTDEGFRSDPDLVLEAPESAVAFVAGRLAAGGGFDVAWLFPEGPRLAWTGGPRLASPPLLGDVPLLFRFPDEEDLPFFDGVVDLDGDGREDLLLPSTTGAVALYQKADGTFERAGPYGPAPRREYADDSLRFLSMNVSAAACRVVDFDGDSRKDLLFADAPSRTLTAYLQERGGRFPAAPTFERPLPFLAEAGLRENEIENYVATLTDIDRNGRIDLVVSRQRGTFSLFTSLTTQELIYFDGPGLFARVPGQVLNLKGVSITPQFEDFDGDGYPDLLASSIRTDLLAALEKAIFKELKITYFVFLYQPGDRRFSASPDFEKTLALPVSSVERDETAPLAYFQGDFDGDGRRDLMVVNDRGGISVFRGIEKRFLFFKNGFGFDDEPHLTFDIEASNRFNLGDFNRDGRSDVVFWREDRVTLVLSRKEG